MSQVCFMFPGQGTQKPGMLRSLAKDMEKVKEVFEIAQEVTGKDIKDLCLHANAEELKKTENTQLAVTAMNMAYYTLLEKEGIHADIAIGHSLGQYSTLVAAGVLTMEQVFAIVQKRADYMAQCQQEGMLCSVLGLSFEQVDQICKEIDDSQKHLVVALYNSQNQIVIGGKSEIVIQAEKSCKEQGALRTVPIRVSNAFHTPLMKEMEESFMAYVNTIEFKTPKIKLVLNCTGDYVSDCEQIKKEIRNQCCHTVLWYDSIKKIIEKEENLLFAEVGQGKVLTGLMRSIDPKQKVFLTSNPKQREQFKKEIFYV